MIQAICFDLDGVLLRTERLKAISYSRAIQQLSPGSISEDEVLDFFKTVVGLSRTEVAQALVKHFQLEASIQKHMAGLQAQTPWEALIEVRLPIYDKMISDPDVLRESELPANIALLQRCRNDGYKLGLATMSYCNQVEEVLDVLGLQDIFQSIVSRDEVVHGKPNPEMYLDAAKELQTPPVECLVVEDSATGVEAALAAHMIVMAIPTMLTREGLLKANLVPPDHIANEPDQVEAVFNHIIAQQNR